MGYGESRNAREQGADARRVRMHQKNADDGCEEYRGDKYRSSGSEVAARRCTTDLRTTFDRLGFGM